MTTNEEMIGRADVNDLEAILAITAHDVDELVHAVKDNADALFTWNYEKGERPALNKLYGLIDTPIDVPEIDVEAVDLPDVDARVAVQGEHPVDPHEPAGADHPT